MNEESPKKSSEVQENIPSESKSMELPTFEDVKKSFQNPWMKGLGLGLIIYVLPALFYFFEALGDFRLWVAYGLTVLLIGSQPDAKYLSLKGNENQDADAGSVRWIMAAGYISILGTVAFYYYQLSLRETPPMQAFINWIGLVGVFSGLTLRIASIQILGKFFTAEVQITKDHELLEDGPYALLRHPSYTGSFIFFTFLPFMLSVWWWSFLVAPMWILVYRKRIRVEERALVDHFGAAYIKYQERTWALFPYIF